MKGELEKGCVGFPSQRGTIAGEQGDGGCKRWLGRRDREEAMRLGMR